MDRTYIMNPDGSTREERDTLKWAREFEKSDRRIANDIVNGVRVSTVFLGIDHNFNHLGISMRGEPILFETMTFNCPEDEQIQQRYSTKDEALAGHAEIVRLLKEKG